MTGANWGLGEAASPLLFWDLWSAERSFKVFDDVPIVVENSSIGCLPGVRGTKKIPWSKASPTFSAVLKQFDPCCSESCSSSFPCTTSLIHSLFLPWLGPFNQDLTEGLQHLGIDHLSSQQRFLERPLFGKVILDPDQDFHLFPLQRKRTPTSSL